MRQCITSKLAVSATTFLASLAAHAADLPPPMGDPAVDAAELSREARTKDAEIAALKQELHSLKRSLSERLAALERRDGGEPTVHLAPSAHRPRNDRQTL